MSSDQIYSKWDSSFSSFKSLCVCVDFGCYCCCWFVCLFFFLAPYGNQVNIRKRSATVSSVHRNRTSLWLFFQRASWSPSPRDVTVPQFKSQPHLVRPLLQCAPVLETPTAQSITTSHQSTASFTMLKRHCLTWTPRQVFTTYWFELCSFGR